MAWLAQPIARRARLSAAFDTLELISVDLYHNETTRHDDQRLARAGSLRRSGAARRPLWRSVRRPARGLSLERVRAATGGVDLGPLAPRLPEALRTPSGKIELAPEPWVAELARAAALLDEPAPALVVIGRRHLRSNNSWMHNLPSLASGKPASHGIVHDRARSAVGDLGALHS